MVIQNEDLDASVTPMVMCLPLTSQVYPSFTRWRVTLSARDRLLKSCQVMTDQPRAIDRMRFGDGPLTTLTAAEMAAVEQSPRGGAGPLVRPRRRHQTRARDVYPPGPAPAP